MNGLLDFLQRPGGQGLLGAVAGYASNARRGTPINNIGRGGLSGLLAYGGAQDRVNAEADGKIKRGYMQSQIDENTSQIADRKAKVDEIARVRGLLANFGVPQPGMGATNQVEATLPPHLQIPAQPKIGAQNMDYSSLIRLGVPLEQVKALAESRNFGMDKVARTQDIEGPGGAKLVQGFDDYGRPVGQGVNGYVAPVSVNQGDRTTFVKPAAGVSLPMNMTFADRNSAAQLGLARQRLSFDQTGGVDGGGATQAGFIKQFGKPSAGYRWTADGSQEFIPGGPADQKAQLQKSGEGTVGSVVAELRDKYEVLNKEGGIVTTQKGAMANMGARIGSTGIGQTLGGAVGTKAQSARESVAMTRPLLLQAIMKATGMSAKQMDSNAELKLYLATATDPTMGLEANKEALDRIEKLYGGGVTESVTPPPTATEKPKPQVSQAAINDLKMRGPKADAQFDLIFGQGAAARARGAK